jgi:hypothetical protein
LRGVFVLCARACWRHKMLWTSLSLSLSLSLFLSLSHTQTHKLTHALHTSYTFMRTLVNTRFRPGSSDYASNKTRTILYETIQLGGCIAIQSVCDERGAGRGKQARKAGADDAVKAAATYFAKNRPRTEAAFQASRAAAKRMDKKCSIV